MFDILYCEYLCLPLSRCAEMLYYTLGKSPVLLRTIELCKQRVTDGHHVLILTASLWVSQEVPSQPYPLHIYLCPRERVNRSGSGF